MLSNKVYDVLKYVALIFIPALVTLVLTVGKIWELPFYDNIGATISAIGVFLGGLLGVSSHIHNEPYPMNVEDMAYIEDEEVEVSEVE